MDLATVDKLLTTTRTVRKRLDFTRPVAPEIIQTCLEIAIQAPTGGNIPRYHFVVVTDAAKRTALAALYKRAYFEVYSPQRQAEVSQSDPCLIASATYLAEHMHEVPVLIIPCVEAPLVQGTGPGPYASILPATWSLMLALRARGLGSAWTTLHLRYEEEVAASLSIPEGMRQAVLLPVAYYTGKDFKPAKRVSREVVSVTTEELRAAEEEAPLDDFPEWQHDALRIARDIVETDHYLPLPDRFEMHEYSLMERFCHSVDDDDMRADLCGAIRGRVAFRRFKDRMQWYGMAEE